MDATPVVIASDDDDECVPIVEKVVKQEILLDDENRPFTRMKTVKRYIYSSDSDVEECIVKKRPHSDSDIDFAPSEDDSDVEFIDCEKKPKKRPKTESTKPRNVNQNRKRKADKKETVPKKKIKSEAKPKKTKLSPRKAVKTSAERKPRVKKETGNEIPKNLMASVIIKEEQQEVNKLLTPRSSSFTVKEEPREAHQLLTPKSSSFTVKEEPQEAHQFLTPESSSFTVKEEPWEANKLLTPRSSSFQVKEELLKQNQPSSSSCTLNEKEETVLPDHNDVEKGFEGTKQEIAANKKALPKHAEMYWRDAELLSDIADISIEIAQNIINLFDTENTIPFIARYRKELTGNMEAEKLRHVKDSYEYIKAVKQKAIYVMQCIAKLGKLTPDIEKKIKCCRSINEIEHFYEPYKTGRAGTLADRARKLGLEAPAMAILSGEEFVPCDHLVKQGVKGLSTIQEVITGCQHIIAAAMSKDEDLVAFIRDLRKILKLRLECKKGQKKSSTSKAEKNANIKKEKLNKDEDVGKFENYYDFSACVDYIKPHQILGIHRGENLKALSVKIIVPEFALHRLLHFCRNKWMNKGKYYPFRETLLVQSCKDAYNRLIEPLIVRQVRAELLQKAEFASIEVFASNLKSLLLSPPLRGKTILGIDPGFRNGCKLAVISKTGEVIRTDVIYPHTSKARNIKEDPDAQKLKDIITTTKCDVIALGNGTACRQTEEYLSHLISGGWFKPLDVSYVIVAEEGASIYSCSPVAKAEFPTMDPNLISAVSLARRLQDPMAELVKVEPKHLGVGMYQHDVPEKKLVATLDEIVSECVSFVGVDINTASHCILRHVAGLSTRKVDNIIEWRSLRGPFINRNQLKLVKGIGNKTFEQCAGFIRVMPQTLTASEINNLAASKEKPNVLDQTWIHPESYGIVDRFLDLCRLKLEEFGTPEFVRRVQDVIKERGISNIASELECSDSQLQLIADALQKPPGHDLRCNSDVPLFRKSINSMESLQSGQLVTGCVRNVTHFGAFVDIGVGRSGLIHNSAMKGAKLSVGQKVEVAVLSVDLIRKRISLQLRNIL